MRLLLLLILGILLPPDLAHAYVGPGLGVGAIGSILGVICAVMIALFAVVYYPVKRALRRMSGAKGEKPAAVATDKAGRENG
jgi:hypothetical protein